MTKLGTNGVIQGTTYLCCKNNNRYLHLSVTLAGEETLCVASTPAGIDMGLRNLAVVTVTMKPCSSTSMAPWVARPTLDGSTEDGCTDETETERA